MEIGDKVSVFDLVYDNNAPTLNLHFVPGVESSDGGHYQAMKTGTTRRTTSRTTTQKKKTSKEVAKPKEVAKSKTLKKRGNSSEERKIKANRERK